MYQEQKRYIYLCLCLNHDPTLITIRYHISLPFRRLVFNPTIKPNPVLEKFKLCSTKNVEYEVLSAIIQTSRTEIPTPASHVVSQKHNRICSLHI